MIYFDLKVGFSCNNDCIHCVITDKKGTKDLTTQKIKDIIDTLSSDYIIGFTGGEPTIRKDFIELCKYAKDTGHYVALQTNGVMFHNKDFTEEATKYIDNILIAIHSSDEDVNNNIVQSYNGSMYNKTIQGFKNIIESETDVQTQTVISTLNSSTLLDTYNMIQKMKPGVKMNMTFPHPNGAAWYNSDIVVPMYEDIKDEIQKVLNIWAEKIQTEAIPICYLYPYHNIVDNVDDNIVNGEYITEGLDPANSGLEQYDDNGQTDNYQDLMFKDKRKAEECKNCIYNDRCAGVWKEYIEIHDFKPTPITEEVKSGSIILHGSGNKCANTCIFCNGTYEQMPDKDRLNIFKKEADYFIENEYKIMEISGEPGEFMLLPEAINYLKKGGILQIQLSTHGRTLKSAEFVRRLKTAGLDLVRIPLYGSTKEIHNMTTQSDKSFEETIRGIDNCVKQGLYICGHTVINNYNKDDLLNIGKLYHKLAGNNLYQMVLSLIGLTEHTKEYLKDWHIPIKDIGPYIKQLLSSPIYWTFIDIPYCTVGTINDKIYNNNDYPDLGKHDIEEQNRSENDSKIPHYRVKSHFDECDKCIAKDYCDGIMNNELSLCGGTDGLKAIKKGGDMNA